MLAEQQMEVAALNVLVLMFESGADLITTAAGIVGTPARATGRSNAAQRELLLHPYPCSSASFLGHLNGRVSVKNRWANSSWLLYVD